MGEGSYSAPGESFVMTGGRKPPAATCFWEARLLMMMIALNSLARQKEDAQGEGEEETGDERSGIG